MMLALLLSVLALLEEHKQWCSCYSFLIQQCPGKMQAMALTSTFSPREVSSSSFAVWQVLELLKSASFIIVAVDFKPSNLNPFFCALGRCLHSSNITLHCMGILGMELPPSLHLHLICCFSYGISIPHCAEGIHSSFSSSSG